MRFSWLMASAFPTLLADYAGAEVPLVTEGQAEAVVVTAEAPGAVIQYAVEELVYHVEKATGVKLPTATEKEIPHQPPGRVFVGDCRAAREAGIEADRLGREACVLKTQNQSLFIVGKDDAGDPLAMDTSAGTLWGVYEVLEQTLKVRWLWPGELGVFVPRTESLEVSDLDRTLTPWLLQRNVRSGLGLKGHPVRAFSPEVRQQYGRDQAVFLRRHRMGRAVPLSYGHAFEDWWAKYGSEHPEWFQLLENGQRGPAKPGSRYSMCVSDPGLHRKIVELWKEARAQNPGRFLNINCCENDIQGLCTCERCRSWDGPQPENLPPRFGPRCVSDRYARFWLAVQQLAAQEDPEAIVIGYAYVNYAPPPTSGLQLNDHIFVGTVPDVFFPRSEEEQAWVKQQWAGWAQTGVRLFLRPNYTLDGYSMPHIYTHQFADEFQFEARHGMVATDFDSLTGQWATQGPNLYLLMRLHQYPQKAADDLLTEYYSGFGPAAPQVKAYFDYWEQFANDSFRQQEKVWKQRGSFGWGYPRVAHQLFPPECFPPAEKLLEEAQTAAGESEYAARVEFLWKGLTHARLCAEVSSRLPGPGETSPSPAYHEALARLTAFRRAMEKDYIANLDYCAWVEDRNWPAGEG